MKNFIKILVVIAMGLFLNSCYYDSFPQYTEVDPPEIPDDISYSQDIMPLWEGECVACHNGSVAPDLRPATSYNSLLDGFVEAGNSEESILYLSLIHAPNVVPMPTATKKWPADKTGLVKGWIDQGAKNN
jgi:pentatricopeptide repeat protein